MNCNLDYFYSQIEIAQFIPSTRRNFTKRPIDAVQTVFDRRSQFNHLERNFIMTKTFTSSIAIAICALAASSAMAAPTTVASVQTFAYSDLINPQAFARVQSDKTRAQVRAEMLVKNLDIAPVAFTELTSPKAFAKPVSTKTRLDVVNEMVATQKTGKTDMLALISGFEG